MKSTIKGLVYDTDKATEVASWWNNLSCSDFHHVSETLYRTAKGTYFLHGEGGALSSYRETCGANSWTGGARITPMTEEKAFDWCEERHQQDAIDAHFGHMVSEA